MDGWPHHLKTAYVDSGSNVDPVFEAQLMLPYLVESTGRSEEDCIDKLKELEFTEQMMKGTIGALSGGWQMKHRIVRAVLMDPDIYLLGRFDLSHRFENSFATLSNDMALCPLLHLKR